MAFDIQGLIARLMGQGAQPQPANMLMQPNAQPETMGAMPPQNQLMAAAQPQIQQQAPMPPAAAPQQAPGFMDKFKAFQTSDMGGRLNDMFTGWAMGATPQDSIGKGAFMVNQGNQTRKGKEAQNQTVAWLKSQGMDEGQAKLTAGNQSALSEFLKQKFAKTDPKDALELQKMELEIKKLENPEGPKPTSSIQEYEYAKGQGFQGTFQEFETQMKKAGASSVNVGFNATEANAAGFADRAAQAEQIINDPKLSEAAISGAERVKANIPVVGNYLTSNEYKMVDQAKRNFVNAILRKESGAVIAPSEFDNADKQYFPQPGDTPEVIAQKAANRKVAIEGLGRSAGASYTPPPSLAAPAPAVSGAGNAVDYTDYFK